jgi:hypothetical protein
MNTFSKENDPPVKTTNQATDKLPSVALETSDENTTAALQRLLEELEARGDDAQGD